MNRSRDIPLLLAVLLATGACAGLPSPPTRPRPAPDLQVEAEDGQSRFKREEWFFKRRHGADDRDGEVPVDLFARAVANWRAWSASHRIAVPAKDGGSPFSGRIWQEMGPRNIAGRVLSVAVDPRNPDVLWAGSAGGGLYRSADFGQTWQQKGGDHLPSLWIGALALDPGSPDVLYLGTGDPNSNLHSFGGFGGLLKTTDGGETFQALPIAESAFFRTLVSAADSKLVLTAAKTGLYRSADAGGHFTRVLAGEIPDFAQDPKNASRFVAVKSTTSVAHADSGLFESLDAGVTWHPLGAGLPPGIDWGRGAVAFPPPPSTALYLALDLVAGPLPSSLFRSADAGQTWTSWAADRRNGYGGMTSYGAHLYLPLDDSFLVQANGYSVLTSHDGGRNWAKPGGSWHVDTHGAAFPAGAVGAASRIALATDGGVAVSTDGGATFARMDQGFPTVQFYSCAIGLKDGATLFGGTQDNWMNVYRGASGGAWEFSYPPNVGDVGGLTINPAAPDEISAATAYAFDVGFSADEGRTWTATRHRGIPADDFADWAPHPVRSPQHPQRVALGAHRLLLSGDGGQSWSAVVIRPIDPALTIVDTAFSPAHDAEIWTLWSDGKVFISEDGGATWNEHSPPPGTTGTRPGTRISAGPLAGTAYAALGGTTGARLFRTRDAGATWDDIGDGLPDVALDAVLADPRTAGRLYVATDAGVATSGDDGATWQDASGDLPSALVFDLCLDPASGRLAAATYGRGMWELKPAPPCVADATTLCLNDNRFEVKAAWETPAGATGAGQARPLTADTGAFTFFDPANVEAVIKVIDGCALNHSFWVFAGGLTDVRTTLTVRDTATGKIRTYVNPQKTAFQPIQDTSAFLTCP
jgi:photosystem II stability/assembly factor-like uncharacterized protein